MSEPKRNSGKSDPPVKNHGSDVLLMHNRSEDGRGIQCLRARNGELLVGELRAIKQGAPLGSGEIVSLSPRPEHPLLWDVDVKYTLAGSDPASDHHVHDSKPRHPGPARVTSHAYRSNYDNIFHGTTASSEKKRDPTLN